MDSVWLFTSPLMFLPGKEHQWAALRLRAVTGTAEAGNPFIYLFILFHYLPAHCCSFPGSGPSPGLPRPVLHFSGVSIHFANLSLTKFCVSLQRNTPWPKLLSVMIQ